MKTLINSTGAALITSAQIDVLADHIAASGTEFPFAALGTGWSILDGAPPSPQHTWDGAKWVAPPAPPIDRTALAARIDAAVAAIYERPMTYNKEYEQREAAAQAFKNAGYTGAVPPRVAGFASPAGMTAQAAADLILQQAAQLRGALDQLSDLRMKKYAVTRAATDAEAQAAFDATMASIATIAASLA